MKPNIARYKIAVLSLAVMLGLLLNACSGSTSNIDPGTIGDGTFASIVEEYITNRNLPAATVIITVNGGVVDSAATGLRSFSSSTRVTENDHWQIGSLTKGITATLAARLVELGYLSWDTTIADIFPDQLDQIHPDNHSITLTELLRHRAGLARAIEPNSIEKMDKDRFGYSIRVLGEAPSNQRGSFNYSNDGYTVAGLMLGETTGLSWEDSVQQFLFDPLEIEDSGIGFPDTGPDFMQPVGHIRRAALAGGRVNDYWVPIHPDNSQLLDALLVLAPAGAVYLSKQDYAKYQLLHLRGAVGESEFLSQDSFRYLQIPPIGEDYAMGWYVMDDDQLVENNLSINEHVLTHGGSTGIFTARSVLLPDRNTSIFIAFNSGVGSFSELEKLIYKRLQITE